RGRGLGKLDAVGPGLELVPGEDPAGGAVLEAVDPRNSHALQHPRTDDAARAPGAVHDDGRVPVDVFSDVRDAQGQLAAGHAATARDAEATKLLGRARVENNELLAVLDAHGQILGLDLGDVVDDFNFLAEVLAGNVHAPLGRQPVGDPAVDAAVEHRDLAIAEPLQRARRERGPSPVVVAHDDRRALEGPGLRHRRFELAAGDQARAWDVAAVVLARLPDVDQGERGLAFEQALE